MSVSKALENSAKAFNAKYACSFDFVTFESRVEEFTFFRPNGGWIDVYKVMFEQMYAQALEAVAEGMTADLDSEAMLDDFEYTLIRPYVSEGENEIKHKPYAGLDRIARLEYLERLTKKAPSSPVALYIDRYKRGVLTLRQMRSAALSEQAANERCVEIAGYILALECVNDRRSFAWRVLHPFKCNAEKRDAALLKSFFLRTVKGGEKFYNEIATEAYETFEGHKRMSARLLTNRTHAMEDLARKQKINDAMRENSRLEIFDQNENVFR